MNRAFFPLALCLFGSSGCSLTELTANSTADLFSAAAPSFDEHWDYELAGAAAPGSIMQLEGVLHVVPENAKLQLQLAKAYVGYAYGWVEDDAMRADAEAELERADAHRLRARRMYLRARDVAVELLRSEDKGIDAALKGRQSELEGFLRSAFDDAELAPALFWAGYAWGSAVNVSRDEPALIADLPKAVALVRRSVELDPSYYHAAGLTFLASVEADFPKALGGDPEAGRKKFEKALELTGRKALLVQLNFARYYAVATQDEALFAELLNEIVAAADPLPSARLGNVIAQRRASFLLENPDLFF